MLGDGGDGGDAIERARPASKIGERTGVDIVVTKGEGEKVERRVSCATEAVVVATKMH